MPKHTDTDIDLSTSGGPLETFYVYRSLLPNESWGAVLAECKIIHIPNINFGMHIFARNKKEAIARARDLYERIHIYDSDKKNISKFTAAALKTISKYLTLEPGENISNKLQTIAELAIQLAVQTNKKYNEYFRKLSEETEESDSIDT